MKNDMQESLNKFRMDVIQCLSEIDVEIKTLQDAVREKGPLTKTRLNALRQNAKQLEGKFRRHYFRAISSPGIPQ